MRRVMICAAAGLLMMLAACAGGAGAGDEPQETSTQAATAAVWREGKDYKKYEVNDKNGARSLWVDFGAGGADVYEDDGTCIARLEYGELTDPDYSKAELKFEDIDNDGYVDITMPYVRDIFGNYVYHWVYNFVSREFMDKYSELSNENEVLWMIANGMLGQNSSRQITQIFNNADLGVLNGNITLDGHVCKAYNISDNGNPIARLYFDQEGRWYIDKGCRQIFSKISAQGDTYIVNGVCSAGRAPAIAAYTLGDYYSDVSGVTSDIVELWTAAGDDVSSVSPESIQNAVNGVVSAYEIVIDDEGTIRRMPRGTNIFDMACQQLGRDQGLYSNLK